MIPGGNVFVTNADAAVGARTPPEIHRLGVLTKKTARSRPFKMPMEGMGEFGVAGKPRDGVYYQNGVPRAERISSPS